MMDINLDLLQWFINFLIKRLQAEQLKTKIFLIKNQLKNYANQLLKNSKKEKYNHLLQAMFWMLILQSISKFNKGTHFVLCVIDIYGKQAWVIPLKNKTGITITNAFQNILKESNRKPSKIWLDKGSEFSIRSVKSWLEK